MTLFVWEHTFRPWKFQKKCPNFLKKCLDFLCLIHKWINLRTDIFHAGNILQPAPVARSLIDGQITSQWHFPPKYLKHPVLLYPFPLPCIQSKASSHSQHFPLAVGRTYILWDYIVRLHNCIRDVQDRNFTNPVIRRKVQGLKMQ